MSKLIFATLTSFLAVNVASANEVKYVVPTCDNVAEVHLDQDFNLLDVRGKVIPSPVVSGKTFYESKNANDIPEVAQACSMVKEIFKHNPNEKYAFDFFVRRNSTADN